MWPSYLQFLTIVGFQEISLLLWIHVSEDEYNEKYACSSVLKDSLFIL